MKKMEGFWSGERLARLEFVEKYAEIMQRAYLGEVGIEEAYEFHTAHRFYTCKYPSVLEVVIQTIGWETVSRQINYLIEEKMISKTDLGHLEILCGGVKHYEEFIDFRMLWIMIHYPKTTVEEVEKEEEEIEKMIAIEKKRHALT
jgi:hypothetical protein